MIGTVQNANTENRYKIILKLKEMNKRLAQCTSFEDIATCRIELLAYIEENSLLKEICQSIEQQLTTKQPPVDIINRIHQYIITLENVDAHFRKKQIIRNKVYKFKELEQVDIITTAGNSNMYLENPDMLFFPSITNILDHNNDYLQQMKNKPRGVALSDLYNLFDDTLSLLFTILTFQYAFEYILIRKFDYIIEPPTDKTNFTAAYLYCIVCAVNNLLQYKLDNYKKFKLLPINKTLEVEQLPHTTLKGRKAEIFKELCKDTTLPASALGEYIGTKTRTIEGQIEELAELLYKKKVKNPKTAIIEYIKMYKLEIPQAK